MLGVGDALVRELPRSERPVRALFLRLTLRAGVNCGEAIWATPVVRGEPEDDRGERSVRGVDLLLRVAAAGVWAGRAVLGECRSFLCAGQQWVERAISILHEHSSGEHRNARNFGSSGDRRGLEIGNAD